MGALHMVPEVCQLPKTWCEPETDFPWLQIPCLPNTCCDSSPSAYQSVLEFPNA